MKHSKRAILSLASIAALAFVTGGVAQAQSRHAPRRAPAIQRIAATVQPLGWRQGARRDVPRGVCQPVYRNGYWKTVVDRVWCEGRYRIEHIPARYATRFDECGRPYQVLISPACERRIWVPGYWDNVQRRVWISTGHHRH